MALRLPVHKASRTLSSRGTAAPRRSARIPPATSLKQRLWGARAHPKSVKCAPATGTHGPSTLVRDALGRQPEASPVPTNSAHLCTDGAYQRPRRPHLDHGWGLPVRAGANCKPHKTALTAEPREVSAYTLVLVWQSTANLEDV
jgi:hypothetical protein